LVVSRRGDAQLNTGASAGEQVRAEEIAATRVGAVRGEGIDFARRIEPRPNAVRGAPRRAATHNDHVASSSRPLALDSHKFWPQVEDQIESLTVG
jgi:hypothetical protein